MGERCYFCDTECADDLHVMIQESPKDTHGIRVPVCEECKEQCEYEAGHYEIDRAEQMLDNR